MAVTDPTDLYQVPSQVVGPVVDAQPPNRALGPVAAQIAIRLRVGGIVYYVPATDLLGRLRDEHLPAFLTGKAANGKIGALRSGLKALLPLLWPLLVADVKKWSAELEAATGCPPLPLPDLTTRHPDALVYAIRYLAALLLSVLCTTEWQAEGESLGSPDGYVRITRLSGAAAGGAASPAGAAATRTANDPTDAAVPNN